MCRRWPGPACCVWPAWLPAEPLDLAGLPLRSSRRPPPPAVDGALPAAAHVLPGQASGRPYPAYAAAIEALDRPALFNRACYRLLSASAAAPEPGLCFTSARYFDGVNVGEALAHELAGALPDDAPAGRAWTACRSAPRSATRATCRGRRRHRGDQHADPAPLPGRRRLVPAALARPGEGHHAGGLYQVIPVGIFQPRRRRPAECGTDLSLWRAWSASSARNCSAPPRTTPRHDGPFDYGHWDFYRRLTAARDAGSAAGGAWAWAWTR